MKNYEKLFLSCKFNLIDKYWYLLNILFLENWYKLTCATMFSPNVHCSSSLAICEANPPVGSSQKGPVMPKAFPCHDIIMWRGFTVVSPHDKCLECCILYVKWCNKIRPHSLIYLHSIFIEIEQNGFIYECQEHQIPREVWQIHLHQMKYSRTGL